MLHYPYNFLTSGLLALALVTTVATASNNIDLSTVPQRDTVQLTIYNSEDLTLVRETRQIVFREGDNSLQFSWANTLIDPTSVEIRFLDHPDKLTVLDTTFPHARPQVLYWNIGSELNGPARVEISYFTSGISWSADYVGIASEDEAKMKLLGYVTVSNKSGEDYENAQIRLVVGNVNLVEKIAELARRGIRMTPEQPRARARVMREAVWRAEAVAPASAGGALFDSTEMAPPEVIKEGLSEYFIFTIEGLQTVPDQWSMRMRSFEADAADLAVQYRYRPREYGDQLVKMYLLTNDRESGMGRAPLPDGVFRIFRDSGRDGLRYMTQQSLRYIPAGDKIELNLGHQPQVGFELKTLAEVRDRLTMRWEGNDWLFEPGRGRVQIDPRATVVGWDSRVSYTQEIRNFTPEPIEVQVRRPVGGDATFQGDFAATVFDVGTVEYTVKLAAGEKLDLRYDVVTREGRHREQNRVLVERKAPPAVRYVP